jgi:hypothetical protein
VSSESSFSCLRPRVACRKRVVLHSLFLGSPLSSRDQQSGNVIEPHPGLTYRGKRGNAEISCILLKLLKEATQRNNSTISNLPADTSCRGQSSRSQSLSRRARTAPRCPHPWVWTRLRHPCSGGGALAPARTPRGPRCGRFSAARCACPAGCVIGVCLQHRFSWISDRELFWDR